MSEHVIPDRDLSIGGTGDSPITLARDNGVVLWDSGNLLQLQQQRAATEAQRRQPPRNALERFLQGIK